MAYVFDFAAKRIDSCSACEGVREREAGCESAESSFLGSRASGGVPFGVAHEDLDLLHFYDISTTPR